MWHFIALIIYNYAPIIAASNTTSYIRRTCSDCLRTYSHIGKCVRSHWVNYCEEEIVHPCVQASVDFLLGFEFIKGNATPRYAAITISIPSTSVNIYLFVSLESYQATGRLQEIRIKKEATRSEVVFTFFILPRFFFFIFRSVHQQRQTSGFI